MPAIKTLRVAYQESGVSGLKAQTVSGMRRRVQQFLGVNRAREDHSEATPHVENVSTPTNEDQMLATLERIEKLLTQLPETLTLGAIDTLASPAAKVRLNNFYSMNHRWIAMLSERNARAAHATYDLIDDEFGDALFLIDQFSALEQFRDDIAKRGCAVLDFGVHKGGSTRRLARMFPDHEIHGFDSFLGLPEAWSHTPTGTFDLQGELPQVPSNVELHSGWFSDSLPKWISENPDYSVARYRIDCDIYSSTKDIFRSFGPRIRDNDFLLFDELVGYRGFEHHEYRALTEFLEEYSFDVEFLAYGLTYVLCRVRQRN